MDPLTALGLAANVFACISFATDLIKGTVEISTSPHGCSSKTLRLESIYKELEGLCNGLKSCEDHPSPHETIEAAEGDHAKIVATAVKIATAVKRLSHVCNMDCDELLRVIVQLKAKGGAKVTWASFRIALRMAWEKKNIDELEERLSRTQTALTLHICTLANLSSQVQSERLEHLQNQSRLLGSDQAHALESIKSKLDAFETDLQIRKDLLTRSDVDCLQRQLQIMSLSEKECAKEQSILQSLTFDTRPVRHAQIRKAYTETFSWALRTDSYKKDGSSMGEWLGQGNGIFWISGKPGSGKSTLMKFIADSPITSELLGKWAQSSKVIIASYYFWLSGTEMQKSYQDLLQTLLYDIFRQSPNLIQKTCTDRWTNQNPANEWSISELRHALQAISRSTSDLKFCFFIDGMDEYNGNHEDQMQLCQIFKDLAESRNTKLCLSSRPWNVFEEAFGDGFPKLYVQDLTCNDIQTYVQRRLQEHARWKTVSEKHSHGQWLVSEITAKSNGVFLWVYLVVKLLREGLTNRDDMFDLRRRLQSFPSELESFFKTILESVQPFYHSHMSTALQVAIASNEELDFLTFYFLAQEQSDEAYAINLPIRALDDECIREIKSNTSWHLDSRTRGLLEVHPYYNTVQFLHRTARDFLMTKEMRDFLATKVAKCFKFNPILSIMKSLVAIIKISHPPRRTFRTQFGAYEISTVNMTEVEQDIRCYWVSALNLAAELEMESNNDSRHHSLLDELDRSLMFLLSKDECEFDPPALSHMKQAVLREQLVQHGLFNYLYSKVTIEPTFLANIGSLPLVRFLTESPECEVSPTRGRGTDVLIHILKNKGVDLNRADCFQGASPWLQLLSHISRIWCERQKNALDLVNFLLDEGILMLCLKAGADPNVVVGNPSTLPHRGERNIRTAAVVYAEFCWEFVDQSQSRQALYLDFLKQILRSSNRRTLVATCDEFTSLFTDMLKTEIAPRSLPFLSRVNNLFSQVSATGMPDITEAKLRQDAVARQVLPLELYTPIETTAKSSRGKRKQKNDFNEGRRKRQT
ncbi:hypothetical protein BJ166DRAFT_295322 [Pestalotiopsis sp. NC0098]|nr:hypothetical protein BJ166DRAFT_295322 [Pestalotiopsis sp. NC0098]